VFKIFQVSIENFEFWLSQTVDFLFSLSTPFFSLLSLSFADSPPLRAQAFRHAAHAPAAALSRCLPPCSMPGLECSPARSPLTPSCLARVRTRPATRCRPPARRPRHQSRRAITAPPPGRVTTPPFPLPARHCLPSYARTHAVDLGGARNAPAAAPRRRRRDKRAQPAPCLHPAPLPCRAPPSLNALPRRRSSIPAPLPSLS